MAAVLSTLIHPMDSREFFATHWTTGHAFFPPRPGVVETWFEGLGADSLMQLLQLAVEPLLVMSYATSGAYQATAAPIGQSLHHFEHGSTLYFDLHRDIPAVKMWVRTLGGELGIDTRFVRVSIFASPPLAHTEWHFDSNENFTVQLTGAKRWLVSSATVLHPIERFTATAPCPPSLRGLETQLLKDVDSAFSRHDTFDLTPGAALYVPRGAWHHVTALDASISLNFCIGPHTWEHLATAALRKRLLKDPFWRRFASRAYTQSLDTADAERQLSAILDRFAEEAAHLTISDLLPAIESDRGM